MASFNTDTTEDKVGIGSTWPGYDSMGSYGPYGRSWAGDWCCVGIRFTSVTVPQGVTISSATLSIYFRTKTGTPVFDVYGNDVDSADAWDSSTNNPGDLSTLTTASTNHEPSGATTTDNIDVTDIVQEIVNRGGWSSGNDMAFVCQPDSGLSTNVYAHGRNWDDAVNIPELTITYGDPKVETLVDNFNDDSLDSGLWDATANVSETNSQLEITTATSPAYYELNSADTYDFEGSSAYVEVIDEGNQSYSSYEAYPLQLVEDSDNKLFFFIGGGDIYSVKVDSSSSTVVDSRAYSNSTHRWLRIRESSGTIYFEYSSDGESWSSFGSTTVAFDINTLTVYVSAGCWGSEAGTTQLIVDNFNTLDAAVQTPVVGSSYNLPPFAIQS